MRIIKFLEVNVVCLIKTRPLVLVYFGEPDVPRTKLTTHSDWLNQYSPVCETMDPITQIIPKQIPSSCTTYCCPSQLL